MGRILIRLIKTGVNFPQMENMHLFATKRWSYQALSCFRYFKEHEWLTGSLKVAALELQNSYSKYSEVAILTFLVIITPNL